MPYMKMEEERAVESGAAMLDALVPGWRAAIDPQVLHIGSTCDCVSAQLGEALGSQPRDYSAGQEWLFGLADGTQWEGFEPTDVGFDTWDGELSYDRLTTAWRAQLDAR